MYPATLGLDLTGIATLHYDNNILLITRALESFGSPLYYIVRYMTHVESVMC